MSLFSQGLLSGLSSGLSSLIQLPIDMLAGGINARRNWKYYQKQAALDHRYNLQTMQESAQIARAQYDYEYEKESPAARVQQLQNAGLNKGLMYSSGATGMQGSVSSPAPSTSRGSMPNMQNSTLASLVSAGSAAVMNQATTKRTLQETENLETEQQFMKLRMLTEQLEQTRKRIENEKDSTQLRILKAQEKDLIDRVRIENERLSQDTKTSKAQEGKAIAETDLATARVDVEKARKENLDALTNLAKEDTRYRKIQNDLEEEFGRLGRVFSLSNLAMSVAKMQSDIGLNNALSALNENRANLTEDEFYLKVFDSIAGRGLDALRLFFNVKSDKQAKEQADKMSTQSKIGLVRLILPLLLKSS